ncbi:MAG: hypothetical protein K2I12_03555 [Duncaniella sp.]|nr:hypothetical protein [Duncaniella sp.]
MKTFRKIYSFLVAASVMVGSLGFTACSDDEEVVTDNKDGVALTYFGTMPATRGETIEIHGKNLNKVKAVVFPIEEKVTDFTLKGKDVIVVTVPEEALAGHLRLLTTSDEMVTSKSLLSYNEEITISSITPTEGLIPGDVVTIKGDCVYNIASVTFGGGVEVPSTEFVSASRRELKVAVPREAQSGNLILSDGNADEPWEYVSEEELQIISPEVTAIDKTDYNFMDKMVITGKYLQFVEKITFPTDVVLEKDEFTISEDGTTITLEIPDECNEGVATLTLANGLNIETPAFTLPVIAVERVLLNGSEVNMAAPIEDLEVGNELRFEGRNLDAVRRIILPKATEKFKNYTLEGTSAITFRIPEGYQDGNIEFYQNPSKSLTFATSMLVELPFIWKGNVELGGWSGNLYPATWDASLWKKFILRDGAVNKPGVMTIYFSHDENVEGDHVLKLTYGDWTTPWEKAGPIDAGSGGVIIDRADKNLKVEITQNDIDRFIADGSFVIYGCGLNLSAVKYEPGKTLGGGDEPTPGPSNDPIEIWNGNVTLSWGAGGRVCVPAEPFETAVAGSILRFTITTKAETWCQAQVNDGAWSNEWTWEAKLPEDLFDGDGNPITSYSFTGAFIPSDMFGWNNFHNYHEADFILTQENIDRILANRGDCGDENAIDCGLIIQGSDITFTKVEIVPQN